MKRKKIFGRLMPVAAVTLLLLFAFWYGGNAPGLRGWNVSHVDEAERAGTTGGQDVVSTGDREYSIKQGMVLDPETGLDEFQTGSVPDGKPVPVNPEDAELGSGTFRCTISISCASILEHEDWLDPEKKELVPRDGWILKPHEVTVREGENVFGLLQKTCKQNNIHMEFVDTPLYNSAYIEGIGNLYEFDCGELSGWMYRVNGWFPNYGCSRYQLKEGDVVEWVYTCELGRDVGADERVDGSDAGGKKQ
ncbi:MAG: DUF4430 domain-containing protein [Bacillota bacterium]|nr:DUF4430 domain-containing protein [Bacillota bacterium]